MERVAWSLVPATSRSLRLCWYAGASIWGGFVLLAVGLAVLLAIGSLAAGDPGPALLVGLLVLVGGPLSLVYLWPVLADADQRPAFLTPPEWLDARSLALGSVVVAVLVLAVPVAAPALFALAIASGILSALLRSEGELDPEAGRLVVDGRTVDLGDLSGVSRYDLGPLSVCRLAYGRDSAAAMAPRLVVLPGSAVDRVVPAIETGMGRSRAETETRTRSNRAVRVVLVLLGLGSLAVCGSLFLLAPVPLAVAVWGTGLFGLLGVLFLWLAYAEG